VCIRALLLFNFAQVFIHHKLGLMFVGQFPTTVTKCLIEYTDRRKVLFWLTASEVSVEVGQQHCFWRKTPQNTGSFADQDTDSTAFLPAHAQEKGAGPSTAHSHWSASSH
jgi:hypothetical protein